MFVRNSHKYELEEVITSGAVQHVKCDTADIFGYFGYGEAIRVFIAQLIKREPVQEKHRHDH